MGFCLLAYLLIYFVSVSVHGTHITVDVWKPSDIVWELVCSGYYVCPEASYPMSRLTSSKICLQMMKHFCRKVMVIDQISNVLWIIWFPVRQYYLQSIRDCTFNPVSVNKHSTD